MERIKLMVWERNAALALLDRMLVLAGQARAAGQRRKWEAFEDAARRAMTIHGRLGRRRRPR